MKRFKANQIKEYTSSNEAREWLDWSEKRVDESISDCIELLEHLKDSYNKYYERIALQNAIRILEMYENDEEISLK